MFKYMVYNQRNTSLDCVVVSKEVIEYECNLDVLKTDI